jgi:peptidoglycan/LPS O-acetylase OafA/YrhL
MTTPEATRFRLGYRPELDGIRGLAVTAVVFSHIHEFPLGAGGGLGVTVFFVLSGFLITVLLVEERDRSGSIDLRAFYARRGLRLLPALYFMLVAFFGAVVLASFGLVPGQEQKPLHEVGWILAFPAAALYVLNWVTALGLTPPGGLEHTWSLASEEQFYLLWPPVLILLLRSGQNRLLLASAAFALGILLELESNLLPLRGEDVKNAYRFDAHAMHLLTGCALGLVATSRLSLDRVPANLLRLAGWLGGIVLVAIVLVPLPAGAVFAYRSSFVGLATAGLIAYLIASTTGVWHSWLSQKQLVWLGRISYSVYLWHYPVVFTLRLTSPPGWAIEIALTLIAATFSYYVIERPALRLKNRLFRRVPEGAPA